MSTAHKYMIVDQQSGNVSNYDVHEANKDLIIARNTWPSGFEELAIDGNAVAVVRFKYWNNPHVGKVVLPSGVIFGLADLYEVIREHRGWELDGDKLLINVARSKKCGLSSQ